MANNRNSANHYKNVNKYKEKKRIYLFELDKQKDADCIEWFSNQKTITGAIRVLVRANISQRKASQINTAAKRKVRREQKLCIDCGEQDERTLQGKCLCSRCAERRKAKKQNDTV